MANNLGMTYRHLAWLWFKRVFKVGWFTTIVADKCNEHWTHKECPNKATVSEYHRGQFGHKIQFQFCDSCYDKYIKWKSTERGSWFVTAERKFEKLK